LITSDCGPEKIGPKKSYCARESVVFYFLSVAFEKKSRSAVASKDSALDIGFVNHVTSSFVGHEYYRLGGSWVLLPT